MRVRLCSISSRKSWTISQPFLPALSLTRSSEWRRFVNASSMGWPLFLMLSTRISDHSVNIIESAEEIKDDKIVFSESASHEIGVLIAAIDEILDLTLEAFTNNDLELAASVEPLEQTVDHLRDTIKSNHIIRLQKSECTIEHGFVLSDILTNCERVSDHCSNIAGCVIELSKFDALNMHEYLGKIKSGERNFEKKYDEYMKKYAL